METLLTLVFMGIIYIVPKMLEKYRAEINKSLKVQGTVPPPVNYEDYEEEKRATYRKDYLEEELPPVQSNVANVSRVEDEKSAWRGKLDQNMIVNGVIFAEILQPPRAYRPFVKK